MRRILYLRLCRYLPHSNHLRDKQNRRSTRKSREKNLRWRFSDKGGVTTLPLRFPVTQSLENSGLFESNIRLPLGCPAHIRLAQLAGILGIENPDRPFFCTYAKATRSGEISRQGTKFRSKRPVRVKGKHHIAAKTRRFRFESGAFL